MTEQNYASNVCFFLLEKTGSVFGKWEGKMSAKEQRELFGRFLGKGTIVIDGEKEVVLNRVKVCFGLDWDDRNVTKFSELAGFELDSKERIRRLLEWG